MIETDIIELALHPENILRKAQLDTIDDALKLFEILRQRIYATDYLLVESLDVMIIRLLNMKASLYAGLA